MTAYGTVAYYRERLAEYPDVRERMASALGMICGAVDASTSDAVAAARVRAVLAALDEVRSDPSRLAGERDG